MPLLILINVFKNVLYWGIFNKIVIKKSLIVKELGLFKTLAFILV
jgi:hypothetical protein